MTFGLVLLALTCTSEALPEMRLERVLRIGAIDDPRYGLSWVGAVAVGPENTLFVSQPDEKHIRVFDREGRFLRRIGREGSGPGEFRGISGIHFSDGVLHARDNALARVTMFRPDGRVLDTYRAPAAAVPEPFFLAAPIAIRRDGTRYLIPNFRVGRAQVDSMPFYIMDPDGNLRIIAHVREGGLSSPGTGGRLVVAHRLPVHGRTLYAVDAASGDVVLIDRPLPTGARRSAWRMLRVRTTGDTIIDRSYMYEPVAIPRSAAEAERRRRVDALVKSHEAIGFPATRQDVEAAFDNGFRVSPWQAAVDSLVLGSSGEVWLRKGGFGEPVQEWYLLDSQGACRARLRLPGAARFGFATRQHIGVIERDDLDVNYVAVYRIVSS